MRPLVPGEPPRAQARLAGALYLLIIILGLTGELAIRSALVVPEDPLATAANILAAEWPFRLAFAFDAAMALSDAVLAVLLYVILRPAGAALALAAMVLRLIQTAILAANLLNQHAALLILTGDRPELAAPEALAFLFLDLHAHGYDLGLIFFGASSLALGALIFRSGYLPRVLGILIAGAGAVYLAGSGIRFLAPGYSDAFMAAYLLPVVAETALAIWLLLKGVERDGWRRATA